MSDAAVKKGRGRPAKVSCSSDASFVRIKIQPLNFIATSRVIFFVPNRQSLCSRKKMFSRQSNSRSENDYLLDRVKCK